MRNSLKQAHSDSDRYVKHIGACWIIAVANITISGKCARLFVYDRRLCMQTGCFRRARFGWFKPFTYSRKIWIAQMLFFHNSRSLRYFKIMFYLRLQFVSCSVCPMFVSDVFPNEKHSICIVRNNECGDYLDLMKNVRIEIFKNFNDRSTLKVLFFILSLCNLGIWLEYVLCLCRTLQSLYKCGSRALLT